MSERILIIDLSESKYEYITFSFDDTRLYGRELVLEIFKKHLPDETGRYDPENLIVIVPGLFAGAPAPSACRMFVATIDSNDRGIQVCNTTGNMPQKLGSLGIAAIVIKGKATEKGTFVHISRDSVDICTDNNLYGIRTSEIINSLKEEYGRDCAITGCGKGGDMMLSLSSFFCTYPDGVPEYHCPRNGFGDVWGAKNLRAVVVDCNEYFGKECADPEKFRKLGKELASYIINDEICGSALPSYGSITIMKILEDGEIPPHSHAEADSQSLVEKRPLTENGVKQNKTCAPMCVIGCLNRHHTEDGRQYSNPSQVETQAAIKRCFGIDDFDLSNAIQNTAAEIGISATEFVTACRTYSESLGIEHGEEHLMEWLDDIELGTLTGKVIASRTYGISELYSDVDLTEWIDRSAVQDESLYDVKMNAAFSGLSGHSALELLYSQIFVLENLGFCIFTSFALLDKVVTFELMAEMVGALTGIPTDADALVMQADRCLRKEREYHQHRWMAAQKNNIPPFTKVLYRFFDSRKHSVSDNPDS